MKPDRALALYLVPFLICVSIASMPRQATASGELSPPQSECIAANPPATASQPKENQYAIKVAASTGPRATIKFGNHFMLLSDTGQAPPDNAFGYGLYRDDTRYLDTWNVLLNKESMALLDASTEDGYAGRFLYSNRPDDSFAEQRVLVERQLLIDDRLHEQIRVTNFDTIHHDVTVTFVFGSDFADMFEVRGQHRTRRGELIAPEVSTAENKGLVTLAYRGLDQKLLKTYIGFSCPPSSLNGGQADFSLSLGPHETFEMEAEVATNFDEPKPNLFAGGFHFDQQRKAADEAYAAWRQSGANITSDNSDFNRWIERSYRDLYILRQSTPKGRCIAAGVPWYAVAFGRDQEITSLETLPFLPDITRDALAVLAAYQGVKPTLRTAEEPGKIMHELRLGEMARLGEIPFIPYYGTIDATPLWLVLLGQYVKNTDDLDFAKTHWHNVEAALAYLDRHTSAGNYLTYCGNSGADLSNQGWKDSNDSIMYGNGKLAEAPIAVCEAQGYLYAAWRSVADIADRLGKTEEAQKLREKAAEFRKKFQKDFWNEKLGYIAIALDGKGRQCDVVSSNAGHLLFTGILTDEQAKSVEARLLQPDMFSGWGIRTLSSQEARYNPLSYHDGSVWPHDNAIIAFGLGGGQNKDSDRASQILSALFAAAKEEPNFRLPELFCGLPKDYSQHPVAYPVSCSPQAWAAGSVFLALQGALGLSIDAASQTVHAVRPKLPAGISHLEINNLSIGSRRANLVFQRHGKQVDCSVISASDVHSVIEAAP